MAAPEELNNDVAVGMPPQVVVTLSGDLADQNDA
jgi:hypothetical protein